METAGPLVRLLEYDSLDSTNAEAQRLAAAGERGPLWIWARRQTAGRGRRGRAWVSEPGNLFATLLIAVLAPPRVAAQASFVASLAVLDVVQAFLGARANLALKWPNDVLLGGKKVAGILVETCGPATPDATVVAIGCGLNLAHSPEETRVPSTALARHGIAAAPDEGIKLLARTMRNWLGVWSEGRGFSTVRSAWIGRAYGLGSEIAVTGDGEAVVGRFEGLADDGALILTGRDSKPRQFHAGEVSLSFRGASGTAP